MSKTAVMNKEAAALDNPMMPRPFRVMEIKQNLSDTFTIVLCPEDGGTFHFAPGQFNMIYVYGVGEVPISISGDPSDTSVLLHTTRSVGRVSRAFNALKSGSIVGVRGPFGVPWPVEIAEGMDLLFVAGGVGLAPLRPAIYQAMNNRGKFGNLTILYGARTPEDILFKDEFTQWRARFDINAQVTVDSSTGTWAGNVGLVTKLIGAGGFNSSNMVTFTCGPEVMMRGVVDNLQQRGVPLDRIYLSMERNMKCGVGLCGHCQWGTGFVCKDGPVFRYDKIVDTLNIREL
jgi:NAD(P)H-flavin reductase